MSRYGPVNADAEDAELTQNLIDWLKCQPKIRRLSADTELAHRLIAIEEQLNSCKTELAQLNRGIPSRVGKVKRYMGRYWPKVAGSLGAIAGAVAGTFIAPGVGTAAGFAAGAAIGGGGRAALEIVCETELGRQGSGYWDNLHKTKSEDRAADRKRAATQEQLREELPEKIKKLSSQRSTLACEPTSLGCMLEQVSGEVIAEHAMVTELLVELEEAIQKAMDSRLGSKLERWLGTIRTGTMKDLWFRTAAEVSWARQHWNISADSTDIFGDDIPKEMTLAEMRRTAHDYLKAARALGVSRPQENLLELAGLRRLLDDTALYESSGPELVGLTRPWDPFSAEFGPVSTPM